MRALISLLVCLSLLLPLPASAGCGWGTQGSGASTDIVQTTGPVTFSTKYSISSWIWITSRGSGTTFGFLFATSTTGGCGGSTEPASVTMAGAQTIMQLQELWSTTSPTWTWTAPAINGWHHLVITHDATSTANVPVVYLDGSSVTVTTATAPAGTPTSPNGALQIGACYLASNDSWDGKISQFAVYGNSTILTAAEAKTLAQGATPLQVRPKSLVFYAPLNRYSGTACAPAVDWGPSHLALTKSGVVAQTDPPTQLYPLAGQ